MGSLGAADRLKALTYLMGNVPAEEVPILADMLGLDPDEVTKKREHRASRRGHLRGSGLSASARVNDTVEDQEREVSEPGLDRTRGTVVYLDQFRQVEAERGVEEGSSNPSEE